MNDETKANGVESPNNEQARRSSLCSNAGRVLVYAWIKVCEIENEVGLCKWMKADKLPTNGDRVYLDDCIGTSFPSLVALGTDWYEFDGVLTPVVMLNDEDQQSDETTLDQWLGKGWAIGEPLDYL